ncbi:hypothetical protein [Paenibacillus larvae]|uniref:Uncharacterized protein n=1 Tax=Paenibacillus larvae TaxID=1464 RepID=A0AAP5N226_9BACL|nr:hypothetical protein [Paenibacillus larvae]ETK29800.1 hypothetical protein ERIC1_1c33590 [Paenibacillus larvae subsp. larvae DSM 25719]MCY9688878.1 hypothetical protein [Paenibacillus larvae]MCY9710027.1 hypothetical protein [Paenibacillus larvae]MCY9718935.1 hypothetical protein [Paenibacillus larvae]MDT2173279.1 hypothetical protein [Paenibacillus larvae]
MKFDISVNIDWLEDESLDEVVKGQIINGVVERISEQTIKSVKEDAEKRVIAKIEELITQTYQSFLNKGVTITDKWGDALREDIKVYDLIKEKCDKWLTEMVNDQGKPSSSHYSNCWSRMEWIVNKQIHHESKRMSDDLVKRVNTEIKKYINDAVKDSIGEKLVKEIGIEELINKTKLK